MFSLILSHLIPLVFVIATPVLLLFSKKLIDVLAHKIHLDGVMMYDDQVGALIERGIQAVENKSLAALRGGAPATPGQQKLEGVLNFVQSELDSHGLPKKAGEALKTMVEAQLFGGAAAPAPTPVSSAVKA